MHFWIRYYNWFTGEAEDLCLSCGWRIVLPDE